MKTSINQTKTLLMERAEITAHLSLLPYSGTPDIKVNKGSKYLYVRKREGAKIKSTYVGPHSKELFDNVLRICKQHRLLTKQLRQINKQLALLGYDATQLPNNVLLNVEFARTNVKHNIYTQARLEGIATTFPQTEDIIDNGKVNGLRASDVQKILNLKHAWEFILDEDVVKSPSDYYLCSWIAKMVNEGFYDDGGRIRHVPVSIRGTSYAPPIPIEVDVINHIKKLIMSKAKAIDIAIELLLYVMKTQIYLDGNKRTGVIYANHYLISHGQGMIIIPEKEINYFRKQLVLYYETKPNSIKQFLKTKCWQKMK